MRKFLLIAIFILLLVAIPATVFLVKQNQDIRQRAAASTTLSLEPSSITAAPNQQFDVDIIASTGSNLVAGVQLQLTFSAQYLEAVSIQAGDFTPNVLVAGATDSGTASITVGVTPPNYKQGTGRVATVRFKALAATTGPTTINFASNTAVSASDDPKRNVLQSTIPAQVTISGGGGASPVPSPQASPTPGASALPTPAASSTPVPGASASPAASGLTTKITSPASGATVTTARPTISGTSFANALVILSVGVPGSNPVATSTFYANATGAWSYTPAANIANGTYTITVTGQRQTGGSPETVTSQMTINVAGTGGTAVASATPAASGSTIVYASPVSTTSAVPVTGTSMPTLLILGFATLLLLVGVGTVLLPR